MVISQRQEPIRPQVFSRPVSIVQVRPSSGTVVTTRRPTLAVITQAPRLIVQRPVARVSRPIVQAQSGIVTPTRRPIQVYQNVEQVRELPQLVTVQRPVQTVRVRFY